MNTAFIFNKERGLKRALLDSWKEFALNFKKFMRFGWAWLVVAAFLMTSSFAVTTYFVYRWLVPMSILFLEIDGTLFSTHFLQQLFPGALWLLAALVLSFISCLLIRAMAYRQAIYTTRANQLPQLSACALACSVFGCARLVLAPMLLRWGAAIILFFVGAFVANVYSMWLLVPALLLLTYIIFVVSLVEKHIVFSSLQKIPTKKISLPIAHRNLGRWIAWWLATLIPVVLLGILCVAPYGVMLLSFVAQSASNVIEGNLVVSAGMWAALIMSSLILAVSVLSTVWYLVWAGSLRYISSPVNDYSSEIQNKAQ